MNDLVGIIRRESGAQDRAGRAGQAASGQGHVSAPGGRAYNPGWHLALDLRNMLLVAECVAQAALERRNPRRPHPGRLPGHVAGMAQGQPDLLALDGDHVELRHQPMVPMRTDLLELFDIGELKKYMTEEELAGLPGALPPSEAPQEEESTDGLQGCAAGLARRRGRRSARGLPGRGQRGRGRPRRAAPAAGDPGQRPGHPVELQGRQVRLLLDGDQRAAAAGLHDPDVDLHPTETLTITPMRTFPVIRDLVTDVSFNYAKAREIPSFTPTRRSSWASSGCSRWT
jgi:hypothetical protein